MYMQTGRVNGDVADVRQAHMDRLQIDGDDKKHHDPHAKHGIVHSPIKLAGCALGILVCYFYFGILQEQMYVLNVHIWHRALLGSYSTKSSYGGNKFTYTQALVFVQCVVNALFSWIGTCQRT
jgi:hypothetical protein